MAFRFHSCMSIRLFYSYSYHLLNKTAYCLFCLISRASIEARMNRQILYFHIRYFLFLYILILFEVLIQTMVLQSVQIFWRYTHRVVPSIKMINTSINGYRLESLSACQKQNIFVCYEDPDSSAMFCSLRYLFNFATCRLQQ